MDFKKIISDARPNIKESSLNMYNQNLKKIIGNTDNIKELHKFEEIKEKIKDKTDNTKRNYYNSIIVLLQAKKTPSKILRKYESERDELNEKYDTVQSKGKLTEKDKKNFVSLNELKEMLKKMKKEITLKKLHKKPLEKFSKEDKELYDGYFLFSSYLELPLRNDLADVEIITKNAYNQLDDDDKKNKNFLVMQNGAGKTYFLSLNNYKTNKKYDEKIIQIPKELMYTYRQYVAKQRPFKYLITTRKGQKVTRNYFTQFLQKISKKYLDKSISTTLLRKIILSDKFAELNKEKEEMSHITGHSVSTMDKVYIKQSEEEDHTSSQEKDNQN
tara:strand:- start:2865 stop:3854 length:990 start_codon:yes stop_codon:yes gene_type:complete